MSPGEARQGRPPARSSRARARRRSLRSGEAPPYRAPATPIPRETPPLQPFAEPTAPMAPASSPPTFGERGWEPEWATSGAATATATLDPEIEPVRADETPPGSTGKRRSSMRNTVEWVAIIAAALVAAVVIKTYLIQAFYIPSASMEPTLNIQDRVLVNKLSYRLHDVHRGDIVVFERPPNDRGQIRDLIKRVIGLPGETVEGRDGTIYVDGRPLREPYLPTGTVTSDFGPKQVPDDYVWVMGDNRGNSSDSRVFGAIAESSIVGRAFIRVWPITAIHLL